LRDVIGTTFCRIAVTNAHDMAKPAIVVALTALDIFLRYLVAPSAYKGFFSPAQIANAIGEGIRRADPTGEVVLAPIADGGDGTIEALHVSTGGVIHSAEVTGPTRQKVVASWLSLQPDLVPEQENVYSMVETNEPLAVAELASACGLAYLIPDRLAALDATTRGAGEVLQECKKAGYKNIVLAVGGSASTDGGIGILGALGARFFDQFDMDVAPCGRHLKDIVAVDLSACEEWKRDVRLRVATDVVNPLLGQNGAARIFAPQKGASQADVELLEQGLSNFADVLESQTDKLARGLMGAGAAGGVPFGLAVALDAEIIPGFRWIASLLGLETKVRNADIVVSGEGRLDSQSLSGKATGELANMCKTHGKPFYAIPALEEPDVDWPAHGVQKVLASAPPGQIASLADVTERAYELASGLTTCS